MEKKVKSEAIYNHWDNLVYIKTDGDMIYVISEDGKFYNLHVKDF